MLEEGADAAKVEDEIRTMPNYFADYDTTVHFISEEELQKNHSGIPHGGFVLRSGKTGWNGENSHLIEYSLKLGLQSGVYFLRSGGICQSSVQTLRGGRIRMQDGVRHCAGLSERKEREELRKMML